MQIHYSCHLHSMLICTGAKGPVWASQRFRVVWSFSKLLKEFFVCHPEQSEGSAFLPNRKENAYSLEARLG